MGMAASQARFLGLTARKTNVEYEGQQINQQRTTLSNETASCYTDLLGMSVPVPPSIEDYTKTVYSFEDGSLINTVTSMIAKGGGNYKLSYLSKWTDDFSAVAAPTSKVTRSGGSYMVGAKTLRLMGQPLTFTATEYDAQGTKKGTTSGLYYNSADDRYYKNYNSQTKTYTNLYTPASGNTATYKCSFDDEYLETLSSQQIARLQQEEAEYIRILVDEYGGTENDWEVRYEKNTTSGAWEPIFCKKSQLDGAVYDQHDTTLQYIDMYTIGSKEKAEEIKMVDARFEQDATGRIINITLHPDQDDEVTYAVTTNVVSDQEKYDAAMNQYEYDKAQYEHQVQEINAKIEIIQAEDRNLELRLKQLDTEQEAIQTEMDAVQKVIEKNTESSFKTFG